MVEVGWLGAASERVALPVLVEPALLRPRGRAARLGAGGQVRWATGSRESLWGQAALRAAPDGPVPWPRRGPPRRPPPHILDQVKSLNQSLRLGHLLCRSRNPDFLLNIIQRQARPTAAGEGHRGRGSGGGFQLPGVKRGHGRKRTPAAWAAPARQLLDGPAGRAGGAAAGVQQALSVAVPRRPRRSPCPGWPTWCRPARAPWTCCPCSACASSCCTTPLPPPPQKRRRRAGARSRRPRSGRSVAAANLPPTHHWPQPGRPP